jgi:hypothetical protein
MMVAAASSCILLASAGGASAAIVINEVDSQPIDFVELYNTGAVSVDIGGYTIDDSSANPAVGTKVPPGTMIAAGGYYVMTNPPGLGNPDAVHLYDVADVELDSYEWLDHASETYGRCPDGTGAITATLAATSGTGNTCLGGVLAWPGSPSVQIADVAGAVGTDLCGLVFQASGTTAKGYLYASRNDPSMLYRFVHDGTTWVADTTDGWTNGKVLRYPAGNGAPDAEGVTIDASDPGAVYVAAERDGGGVSAPVVLRYDVTGSATTLDATDQWNLTDLVGLPDNGGPEAITWIPDVELGAKGYRNDAGAKDYAPADFPGHGGGLFFVGVEEDGSIRSYALNRATDTATPVSVAYNAYTSVMDLEWEAETQRLWAVCDDTCDGRHSVLEIAQGGGNDGRFVVTSTFSRPATMPNLNNEGFAIAPQAECSAGFKPVVWADDEYTGGHALRTGTLPCTPLPTVSLGGASVVEGAGGTTTLSAPVTLSSATTAPVTVRYSTGGGGATAGSDYTAVVGGSVTIPAGQTTGTAAVTVAGDTIDEGASETFDVTLSAPVNAALGTASAVQTIVDDDEPGSSGGTPPPPGASPPPTPLTPPARSTKDTTKPRVTSIVARRTQVAFRLSERARVTVTVDRRVRGRYRRVKQFTVTQSAGMRTVRFRGRVPASALRPGAGRLRITMQATDAAGNKSASTRKTVR